MKNHTPLSYVENPKPYKEINWNQMKNKLNPKSQGEIFFKKKIKSILNWVIWFHGVLRFEYLMQR